MAVITMKFIAWIVSDFGHPITYIPNAKNFIFSLVMHTSKESARKASGYKFYTYLSMGEIMPFKYYRLKK